jgi:superfamily II DNA/RNA helicase
LAVLRTLLRGAADFKNAIVFCNRKRDVATLQRSLAKHGFNAGALHGDMDQRSRTQTLDDFRKDKLTILVASDVAARGLDIPAVSHIFNFDVPTHAEDYIHRIGRTGRAGLTGTAITIATPIDAKYIAAIEKLTGFPIDEIAVEAAGERAAAFSRGRAEREQKNRGERRGGRRRSESRPEPAPAREQPPGPVAKAPSAPPDEGARDKQKDSRRKREDAEPVVGLGDHVPNFLLRPTRVSSS